jgi:hypothetical protein
MTYPMKLSVSEFGELANSVLDALENREPTIPTRWGVQLIEHIEAMLREEVQREADKTNEGAA